MGEEGGVDDTVAMATNVVDYHVQQTGYDVYQRDGQQEKMRRLPIGPFLRYFVTGAAAARRHAHRLASKLANRLPFSASEASATDSEMMPECRHGWV